jgi:hypothetical protein
MLKRQSLVFALPLILVGFTSFVATATPPAQSCNPAVVSLILRDEKGNSLSENALQTIYEQLPKLIGDAPPSVGEVSFADDGKTYYWPEDVDFPKGRKVSSIKFVNNETCTMHFPEVTLKYQNTTMRLVFNIDISRTQQDRRPVIQCPTFQEGAFQLDLQGWSREPERMITAERWKKL